MFPKTNNKLIRVLIGVGEYLISFVAIYFIVRLIINNWYQIQGQVTSIKFGALLASLIAFILSLFIQGIAWFYLHKKIGKKVRFFELLYAYYASIIVRYIPGNIWSYLMRLRKNKKLGISESETLYLSLIEIIFFLISSWLVFILSILLWTEPLVVSNKYTIIFIVSILFLVFAVFSPRIVKWYIKSYMKGHQVSFAFIKLPWHNLIKIFLIYFIYWAVAGLGLYFSLISIYYLSPLTLPIIFGINAVAWLIGFVSFITPSGIGAREPALIFFLVSYVPTSIAGAVSIISRLIMVVSEIIILLVVKLITILIYEKKPEKK